ncbi:MAG: ornithine carbamoyltransferase [Abitibacteriaceae bacterium]|nr:ornithine carbamoyltransferase [Abditibacteriaceae bacterium]
MRDFLSINDLSPDDAQYLIAEAVRLKRELRDNPARQRLALEGRTLALVFEKPSLRTRVSFDIGMYQLGGHAVYLSPAEIGLGQRESVGDIARVLSRMCNGIMARVFDHATVTGLAEYATVPVINGLSDLEHPCQALADLLTLHEHKGLAGHKMAYLGDGNNICHSLMLLCAKLGVRFAAATPEGYEPLPEFVHAAKELGEVEIVRDPKAAVQDADAVYTDVWTSMGQEAETAKRNEVFPAYQVNAELMRYAKPDAIVLHDLPAHRGEEITDEVMDSPQSVIFDQAENRLHAQKAVLVWLLGTDAERLSFADTPLAPSA